MPYQDLTETEPIPSTIVIGETVKSPEVISHASQSVVIPFVHIPTHRSGPTDREIEEDEQARGDHEPLT